nr:hypothetical protein [Streptomyces sp. 3211]
MVSDVGPAKIDVPSDREGVFEPQIVRSVGAGRSTRWSCRCRQKRPHSRQDLCASRRVHGAEASISTITDFSDGGRGRKCPLFSVMRWYGLLEADSMIRMSSRPSCSYRRASAEIQPMAAPPTSGGADTRR